MENLAQIGMIVVLSILGGGWLTAAQMDTPRAVFDGLLAADRAFPRRASTSIWCPASRACPQTT